jgi:PAS domain S-box-containing protein
MSRKDSNCSSRAITISGFGVVSLGPTLVHLFRSESLQSALLGVVPPLVISIGFVALGAHLYHRKYDAKWVRLLQRWHLAGAGIGGVVALVILGYQMSHGGVLVHPEYLLYNTVVGGAGVGAVFGYHDFKVQQRAAACRTSSDIFDTVRKINRGVVTAEDRETLERHVCETIAAADSYALAWVGDVHDGELTPRASAGVEREHLDDGTLSVDEGTLADGPAGSAVRTLEPQVVRNRADALSDSWRAAASEREYRSMIALPLAHEETRYGVLCIYADRPAAFTDREYDVLVELGDTIANAIDAIELRHSQTALLDGMADAAFVYSLTQESLVAVNQAAVDRLGYGREELLSMHPEDFDVSDTDCVSSGRLRDLRERGQLVFETVHEQASGDRLPVEINATAIQYRGEPAVLAVARDVRERRERERRLRSYREAIEHAGHAIYITDTDGTIDYVNPAFEDQTGYRRSDVVGETPNVLKSGHHDDAFYGDLWETILDGEVWHNEEMIDRRKDGTTYYVDQTIAPITDEDGEIERFVAVSQDITELKEHEERLEEQTEQLELLNRLVRHDIRNDMTVILGFGEMLRDDVPEAYHATVDRILETGRHTVELTRTARDLVDMIGQSEDPELRPTSLSTALRDEFDNTRRSYPDATFDIGDVPDVEVRANDLLPAVFRNLLHNAIQHNDNDTPHVDVSVTDRGDRVVVRIADDGPGVRETRKEAIFGKEERRLDSPGTGMGLYFVDTLVDQYGGDVRIEDNDPDGAVFVVELPAVA